MKCSATFPNGVSPYADRLASGNLILSLSAVKFIVAPSAWPRRTVLDRVVEIAAGAPMTSLSPLRLTDWSLFDVQYSSNREFTLSPRHALPIAVGGMMAAPVHLEKSTRYLVTFEARMLPTTHALPSNSSALNADFSRPLTGKRKPVCASTPSI